MVLGPDDSEGVYKNQFIEFLRKNKPSTEELPKPKDIKVKRKKRSAPNSLDI